MKVRPVIAIVAGGVAWGVGFPLLVTLLAIVWPALHEAVQAFKNTGRFDVFTDTSMLIVFQLIWLLTNCVAGLVTGLIGRRKTWVLILAGILLIWFAYNHFWAVWDQLPAWYNVLVVILVVPMVIAGGTIADLLTSRPKSGNA